MSLPILPYVVDFVPGPFAEVVSVLPPVETLPELRTLAERIAEALNAVPVDLGTNQIGVPGPLPDNPLDMHLGVLLLADSPWHAGPYFMIFPYQELVWAVVTTAVPGPDWLVVYGLVAVTWVWRHWVARKETV
jgi:hypothetical protein